MRNYTLDDFRRIIDKLTSTPEIFRKNFDNLYDVLYETGIEYYNHLKISWKKIAIHTLLMFF